ncbi:dihydroorotate dehydrogenase electron transfer subunit [Paenibacillus sambharensis]|uniref:Dihydroorotate dehydrogenase B (NAD(+)), electron transfer subunit n=1 Tax=Paenibacillus sambharensis TaxID=1803190 RepID=A0A2W1L3C7_9BACL|nr:dihydroorotate dehydrogenase electron transfer subunit [Paenibacillus sambharensis]PZD94528.1 dihydroorotate dehydrogenase electron transfer subunit [Paenibacillus sambharensis]
MKTELCRVVSHDRIADRIYELVLEGTMAADMLEPGRFVHVKVSGGVDPLLRRPISICDADKAMGRFTMVYRAEGKGTQLLSERRPGEQVDVLGPLGSGFPVDAAVPGETAVLIGGGIGVPPLYYLSRQLTSRGVQVVHVLGFASAKDMFYREQFEVLGPTHIATVDGSCGLQGYVTDVLRAEGMPGCDIYYACGPTAMLRALEASEISKRGYVSLEERMGCGIGACLACVCRLQDDPQGTAYRKVCTDGPVFPVGEVIL